MLVGGPDSMQQKHRQVPVNVTHQLKNRCTIHGDRARGNCAGRRVAVAGCHACAAALARELNRACAGSIVHGCACDAQHGCANTSTTSMWCSAYFTRYRHGQGHHEVLTHSASRTPLLQRTELEEHDLSLQPSYWQSASLSHE